MFIQSIPEAERYNLNFDLVLLMSNEKEKKQIVRSLQFLFPQFVPLIKFVNIELYILLQLKNSELHERYQMNAERCIVNLKKFVGLHWAVKTYEDIVVVDCDTIFAKTTHNLFDHLNENYAKKKIIMGGRNSSAIIQKIQLDCSTFINTSFNEKINLLTNVYHGYAWFFDIPFYKNLHLKSFFTCMFNTHGDNFWLKIKWESFEHLIYQFYLVCYEKFEVIDYSESIKPVIPEALEASELNKIEYLYGIQPAWVRFKNILDSPENLGLRSPQMIYHMDRI